MTPFRRDKVPFGDVISSQHVAVTDSENELSRPKINVARSMTKSADIGLPRATSTQINEAGNYSAFLGMYISLVIGNDSETCIAFHSDFAGSESCAPGDISSGQRHDETQEVPGGLDDSDRQMEGNM